MKQPIILATFLLTASLSAWALNQENFYGEWRYDAAAPASERLPETIDIEERDGTQRPHSHCGKFETLTFSEATGSEIAEDLAEQMPEVLGFSQEPEFIDYADFSRSAAKWFKPNQTYQIAAWNCGDVGGNYYFVDTKRGVVTSAGVEDKDTFVMEISR